jgi:hypothetical protein
VLCDRVLARGFLDPILSVPARSGKGAFKDMPANRVRLFLGEALFFFICSSKGMEFLWTESQRLVQFGDES